MGSNPIGGNRRICMIIVNAVERTSNSNHVGLLLRGITFEQIKKMLKNHKYVFIQKKSYTPVTQR